jgi:predicted phage-related endonuclease
MQSTTTKGTEMELITKPTDRTQWLAQRKRTPEGLVSFGGSDAPILMGVSPFRSRGDLFVEKATLEVNEAAPNAAMTTGNYAEPMLLQYASDQLGTPFITPLVQYRDGQWLITADGVDNPKKPAVCVECKTTSRHSIRDASDIPQVYLWQMWAQSMVLDCPVFLSVLDRDLRLSVIECPTNPAAFDALRLEAEVFGEWVLRGEPMPDDIDNFSAEQIASLFKVESKQIELGADAIMWIEALNDARKMGADAEALEKNAKDHLARMLLDADTGTINGQVAVTWKQQKGRATTDVARMRQDHPDLVAQYEKQGSPFRVFRTTKGKKQ